MKNLDLTKEYSFKVLLELTSQGLRRDKAYRIVKMCDKPLKIISRSTIAC